MRCIMWIYEICTYPFVALRNEQDRPPDGWRNVEICRLRGGAKHPVKQHSRDEPTPRIMPNDKAAPLSHGRSPAVSPDDKSCRNPLCCPSIIDQDRCRLSSFEPGGCYSSAIFN